MNIMQVEGMDGFSLIIPGMNFFFVWFPYGSEIFARGCFIMPNKL
jgi:hypothetical protein